MFERRLKVWWLALCLVMVGGSALADAIDGHWCHSDGRRFSIRGPEIVTPGGKVMEGNYSRHGFSYVVPTPEPGAGETTFMTLLQSVARSTSPSGDIPAPSPGLRPPRVTQ